MPKLEMIDDTRSVYKEDFPPRITIEQRERVEEWVQVARRISSKRWVS
jgi:hypothetical protein